MTIVAARLGMFDAVEANQRAPRELAAIGNAVEWLNSPRLTASSLAGKVVLVDFWTYTCINWLRTLPYVRAWAQKYRQGLVVIGVHTPEFPFERDIDNVRRAVRQMRIEYPVAIDNDYAIWRAFNNQYWPALYFIDARGRVRQHHFGEGEYERSEMAIQRLLSEAGVGGFGDGVVSVDAGGVEAAADWNNLKSPETYVGYARIQNFASRGGVDPDRRRVYATPARLALNQWALAGEWTIGQAGHRPQRSQRADRPSLSCPRRASRHGSGHGRSLRCVFACPLTVNHRAPLTASTSTTAATARLSSSGCISCSGNRNQSSIEPSKSNSSMPASRHSRSRSADVPSIDAIV